MEIPKIYEALTRVMADVGVIGKNQKNAQQGFKFRSIDDVYNALNPALVKNGVIVLPNVLSSEVSERTNSKGTVIFTVRLKVSYIFYCAEDASRVEATTVAEAFDSGDKATTKALSMAFKNAMLQVFCIPTEELSVDGGYSETPEPVFSTVEGAIAWASKLLDIPTDEATKMLESTPPDASGKKAANFAKRVNELAASKK